jgi:hypothetical protein
MIWEDSSTIKSVFVAFCGNSQSLYHFRVFRVFRSFNFLLFYYEKYEIYEKF